MNRKLNLKPEEELLLKCAHPDIDEETENRIRSLIRNNLNWDYLICIAHKHKLSPLLYHNLSKFLEFPKVINSDLEDYFLKNAQKNLFFLAELYNILSLLKNEKIVAIPFKGPHLSILNHGNVALRDFNDLDIFVHQDKIIESKNILISNGFSSELSLNKIEEKKYIKSQHEYQLRNKEKNYLLELHWKFSELFFYFPNDELDVLDLDNLTSTIIQNKSIKSFSPEDLFIILCIHNAGHRWLRLAWICDVATFCNRNKNIEWQNVFKKAEKMGIKRILLINIYLSIHLFDSKLPSYVIENINDDIKVENISNEIISDIFSASSNSTRISHELIMNLRIRDKISYGIIDSIKQFTKPTILDWKKLDLPIILYPLYYVIRPIRLIMSYRI